MNNFEQALDQYLTDPNWGKPYLDEEEETDED
ncbi:hypothetical protein IGJ76_001983 [Enterococcus sp. DIV0175]